MKALLIARKTLIEAWREPQLLGVYLIFPAAMILVYYLAFGQTTQSMASFLHILVSDQDGSRSSQQFVDDLRGLQFDGNPVFAVELVSEARQAEIALAERKAAVWVILPRGFSEAVENGPPGQSLVRLVGDPYSDNYAFARSFIMQVAGEY
jgi:hypothetical protein